MTYEEAARILDPETSRDALLPYAYDPQYQQMLLRDACRGPEKYFQYQRR